jgi:hypothetical protein
MPTKFQAVISQSQSGLGMLVFKLCAIKILTGLKNGLVAFAAMAV